MKMKNSEMIIEKILDMKVCPYCNTDKCLANTYWSDDGDREIEPFFNFLISATCCECKTTFVFKVENDCQGPEVDISVMDLDPEMNTEYHKNITWEQISDMFEVLNIASN